MWTRKNNYVCWALLPKINDLLNIHRHYSRKLTSGEGHTWMFRSYPNVHNIPVVVKSPYSSCLILSSCPYNFCIKCLTCYRPQYAWNICRWALNNHQLINLLPYAIIFFEIFLLYLDLHIFFVYLIIFNIFLLNTYLFLFVHHKINFSLKTDLCEYEIRHLLKKLVCGVTYASGVKTLLNHRDLLHSHSMHCICAWIVTNVHYIVNKALCLNKIIGSMIRRIKQGFSAISKLQYI